MILWNSIGSISPPKFPSFSLNVWIVNEYFYFVPEGGACNIIDIFQGHGTDPHGWIMLWWDFLRVWNYMLWEVVPWATQCVSNANITTCDLSRLQPIYIYIYSPSMSKLGEVFSHRTRSWMCVTSPERFGKLWVHRSKTSVKG